MESKSILSNQDLAKVFAMYSNGWTVIRARGFDAKGAHTRFFSVINNSVDAPHITIGEHKFSLSECRLELTPLEDISDEHKFAIYGMGFTHVVNERLKIMEIYKWPDMRANQYQQLIIWGYAVPLFFGVNHWANGKTAIQLNIAINKNNT